MASGPITSWQVDSYPLYHQANLLKFLIFIHIDVSSVQLLSHVQLFATPWTAAYKASLSINNSRSLLKLMSIESVMLSNHVILCPSLLLLKNTFSSVQSLSHVRLFATPWIAARQASMSITNFQSSLRLTSIESVMPSSHLILCRPLFLLPPIPPSIRVFSNESALRMRWPKYWSFIQSTGTSFLAKNTQGWSPLEWTGWISLLSKGLSRVFSNTTVQTHQFFGAQLSSQSNSCIHTWPLEKQ